MFAPINDALAKIPKAILDKALADKARLTTSGSGEYCSVNGSAEVVCGNVKTVDADVYIIDTALTPSS
ncbi:hypothetical protein [Streptomyces sp. NPDC001068]|uniref:hypothetical protein n=1 Tax=Streptomyces sp. NPDC001068 TaxID=3364544 RepID=UPI00368924F2